MLWFFFALLAPILWAISNLIDGDLILHRVKSPSVILGLTGLFSGLPAVYVFITHQFVMPSLGMILLGLLAGAVSLLAYLPYFRTLTIANPAEAVLLWNLSPVLIAIGAHVFLGEQLSVTKYLAIALLVFSAIYIERSHVKEMQKLWSPRVLGLMTLASIGTATQALLEKQLYTTVSARSGIALVSIGSFALGLCLFFFSRERRIVIDALRKNGTLLVINQLLDVVASVCLSIAIFYGYVSVVTAIGGIQPLFILAFAWLGSHLFTKKQFQTVPSPPAYKIAIATLCTAVGMTMLG